MKTVKIMRKELSKVMLHTEHLKNTDVRKLWTEKIKINKKLV